MIVAGDNHRNFVVDHNGQILINAGSMIRTTTAQTDHYPRVYVYDTNKLDIVEEIFIPIKPAKEVLQEKIAVDDSKEDLIIFAEELVVNIDSSKFDFAKVVKNMIEEKVGLRKMTEEILGRKL